MSVSTQATSHSRSTARLPRIGISCALLALAGCSSTIVQHSNCGPGTTLVEGTCVPDDAAIIADSAIDASSIDTSPETFYDTAPDSNTSGDDPCPSKFIAVNCSTTCGGPTASCGSLKCGSSGIWQLDNVAKLPFIIRTPHKPGMDPKCKGACSPVKPNPAIKAPAYAVALRVLLPGNKEGVRIRVGAPWRIFLRTDYAPHCLVFAAEYDMGSGCYWVDGTHFQLTIGTDDPEAPSRNIVIELGSKPDAGPQCP